MTWFSYTLWVAYPFSRGYSWSRNRTGVSHCKQILYQLSYQGSPHCEIITMLSYYSIIDCIPVLYITTVCLIHFITGGLYLLIPFTNFAPPHHHPTWQSPIYSLYLWACFCSVCRLVLFIKLHVKKIINCMYKWNYIIFIFLYLRFHLA